MYIELNLSVPLNQCALCVVGVVWRPFQLILELQFLEVFSEDSPPYVKTINRSHKSENLQKKPRL